MVSYQTFVQAARKREETMIQAREVRDLADRARLGWKEGARGSRGMVISSHPIATRAGLDMLRRGGNAADAALATAIAQTVVEPHMSTITGSLCLLYWQAATEETTYLNAEIGAPLAPLPGFSAADLPRGRGVPVPGFWAGFEAVHARFASRSKGEIMDDAIQLARD